MEGAAAQRERCDCRSNYRRVVISGFGAAAVELPSFFLLLFSNQISFVAPLFLFSFFFAFRNTESVTARRPAVKLDRRLGTEFFFRFFFRFLFSFCKWRSCRLVLGDLQRVFTEFVPSFLGCIAFRSVVVVRVYFFLQKKMFIHHRMIK